MTYGGLKSNESLNKPRHTQNNSVSLECKVTQVTVKQTVSEQPCHVILRQTVLKDIAPLVTKTVSTLDLNSSLYCFIFFSRVGTSSVFSQLCCQSKLLQKYS